MQPNTKKEGDSATSKPMLGQVIACAVALGIMGLGAYSLLGHSAPYHPDSYDNAITRGASDLTGISESD